MTLKNRHNKYKQIQDKCIGRYLVDDLGTYMVDQIISALDIDGSDILVSLYPEEESIMIEISSDDDYDASHGLSYGLSDFCENWTMTKNVFAIDGKAYNIDPIFMG